MLSRRSSILFILLLVGGVWAAGQEKKRSRDNEPRIPEAARKKYARILEGKFARLELAPLLPEANETPEESNRPFKVGDKILFRLLITNISSEPINLPQSDTYNHNRLQLLRDGDPVAYREGLNELIRTKDKYLTDVSRATYLAAYETATEMIILNEWYDSLPPGHYQLTLKHRFFWGGDWIEAPSITFEVEPK